MDQGQFDSFSLKFVQELIRRKSADHPKRWERSEQHSGLRSSLLDDIVEHSSRRRRNIFEGVAEAEKDLWRAGTHQVLQLGP